jgi:membrane-associated phospholipid phosphatase
MKRIIIALIIIITGFAGKSQSLDYQFIYEVNAEERPKNLDKAFQFITNTGAVLPEAVPIALLGTGLLTHNKILIRQGENAALSFGVSTFVTYALKHAYNRQRPFTAHPELVKLASGGGSSFPSGHTSAAFALATSIALDNKKWYIIVPAYAWAGLVGYSRIDLGVHYPSDVIAGAVVGFASAYAGRKINSWLHKGKPVPKTVSIF